MTGLFSSQDDAKEFKYADGKLTFTFSMRGESTDVMMEQVSKETGLLAELKSGEGKSVDRSTWRMRRWRYTQILGCRARVCGGRSLKLL